MKEQWLMPGAMVPVDVETTAALVAEIKRLIGVVGDMALKQAEKQESVAELTDDEIHDAAYATFCRGPNTRELFRMMWTCNPPCSIGWDRNELKAFARHIASLYTAPHHRKPWVGLTDEEHEQAKNVCLHVGVEGLVFWLEDKLKEKNT
jgi:hypothetical protein